MSRTPIALLALTLLTAAQPPGGVGGRPMPPAQPPTAPPIPADGTVTAWSLHGDFRDNPINADAKYKGKTLTVIGAVSAIEKRGDRYRVLIGAAVYQRNSDRTAAHVACTIAPGAEGEFRDLKPVNSVTVRGICKGSVDASAGEGGILVELDDCKRVK